MIGESDWGDRERPTQEQVDAATARLTAMFPNLYRGTIDEIYPLVEGFVIGQESLTGTPPLPVVPAEDIDGSFEAVSKLAERIRNMRT